MLPGLVIYHQFRDFLRPTGDKIFVQITSDFLVISEIGENLGNFKPFMVKISDFSTFFSNFSTNVFGKNFTTNLQNFPTKCIVFYASELQVFQE